ncbi:MarR family transcriptional regulator [Paenibacillus sp. LMG 31459]|jgi:DNA-binding MarR family transcriptional regulator|uniref:MarR family transcriptional regulator n=1 Tax=Paenibacillus phytohabitans TaxID=2654978 RepID=A0ABX1YST0_9BACL|nr:MarR family transcriptional regulator [Paenibacillus phytohabitans]NOU83639.1 MarR family transcriptional regulator [Paenibacillus phytohabitans]
MTQDINPLIERVGISMWKVQRKIMSQMSLHKEIGLTVPQFGLLHMIAQEKQARVIHLADKMEVKSSAVTVMLDRLELLELIARVPDENDRRAVIVTITAKGQGVLEEAQRRSMLLLEEHLSILEPEELENFAHYYLLLEKQER